MLGGRLSLGVVRDETEKNALTKAALAAFNVLQRPFQSCILAGDVR